MAFGANAAPKHYKGVNPAGANTVFNVTGAVPVGRALIVSKVIVTNSLSVVQNIRLYAAAAYTDSAAWFAYMYPLGPNEPYTETGLIILAGESLHASTDYASAGNLAVHVFGEEVDAS